MKPTTLLVSGEEGEYLSEILTAQVRGLTAMEMLGGEPLPESGKAAMRCASSLLRKLGIEINAPEVPVNPIVPMGNPGEAVPELRHIMKGMTDRLGSAFEQHPSRLERVAAGIFQRAVAAPGYTMSEQAVTQVAQRSFAAALIFVRVMKDYQE